MEIVECLAMGVAIVGVVPALGVLCWIIRDIED